MFFSFYGLGWYDEVDRARARSSDLVIRVGPVQARLRLLLTLSSLFRVSRSDCPCVRAGEDVYCCGSTSPNLIAKREMVIVRVRFRTIAMVTRAVCVTSCNLSVLVYNMIVVLCWRLSTVEQL